MFYLFFNFSNNLKNFDILYALSSIINNGTFYLRVRKIIHLVCRLSIENSHSGMIDENKIRGWVEGTKIQKDICCKDRNQIDGFTFMNTVLYLLNLYNMSVTFIFWKTIFQYKRRKLFSRWMIVGIYKGIKIVIHSSFFLSNSELWNLL